MVGFAAYPWSRTAYPEVSQFLRCSRRRRLSIKKAGPADSRGGVVSESPAAAPRLRATCGVCERAAAGPADTAALRPRRPAYFGFAESQKRMSLACGLSGCKASTFT